MLFMSYCRPNKYDKNKPISSHTSPVGIYLLKVNNRNTRTRCEICSKLTVKTPEHQTGILSVENN